MGQYLKKYAGVIQQKQAKQILKLLNKKRNSGQIRNMKEFSQQLASLMSELTATTLQPITKLFLASAGETIDSEQYNYMLDRVEDDLDAAFGEANNINIIQNSHETVVRDVILKNLRSGIAELDAKIKLYELLNRDANGFDAALFSTFRESRDNRTHSGTLANKVLFLDPRQPDNINALSNATTELVGERLVLGSTNIAYHNITGIQQIFDSESPQSELIVEPPNTSIKNIIDNTKGTYWIQNILFQQKQNFVKAKLQIDFGITKEFNFLEIDPATHKDLILESISYINGNNTTVLLTDNETVFDGPISIRTKKTAAQKIVLTFRSEHYKEIQFEYTDQTSLLNQAITANRNADLKAVSEDLDKMVTSTAVKEAIGIIKPMRKQFKGYEFVIGIDNIRVGLAEYESDSIYISKPLQIPSVGQVGLKALETRPYINNNTIRFTDDTYNNTDFLLSSIEYWVIKQDYDLNGLLLKTVKFPILPLNVSRIYHERLLLTSRSDIGIPNSDIGYTTFFTNSTTEEGNIIVYRNGIELSDVTNEINPEDGWINVTESTDRTPNASTPMRFKIQIVNPLPGDIFTVSYNPLTSSTRSIPSNLSEVTSIGGLQIIDLVGDLSVYADDTQLITINDPDATNETKEVKLYLAIILRQNTADTSISAAVEEYTLMVSEHNLLKYEET